MFHNEYTYTHVQKKYYTFQISAQKLTITISNWKFNMAVSSLSQVTRTFNTRKLTYSLNLSKMSKSDPSILNIELSINVSWGKCAQILFEQGIVCLKFQ